MTMGAFIDEPYATPNTDRTVVLVEGSVDDSSRESLSSLIARDRGPAEFVLTTGRSESFLRLRDTVIQTMESNRIDPTLAHGNGKSVRPDPDTTVTKGADARRRRQIERKEAKDSERRANHNETSMQRIIRENAEEHASYRPLRKVRGLARKQAKRARGQA